MKAKIRTITVVLEIALTDHTEKDTVKSLSGRTFRPLTLEVTYSEGYERGYDWNLYAQVIEKDGSTGAQDLIHSRYTLDDPELEARLDKLAEDSNPLESIQRKILGMDTTVDI